MSAEPDYVDCQMLISGQERKTPGSDVATTSACKPEVGALGGAGGSLLVLKDQKGLATARHSRTRSPPSAVKYAVKHSIGAAAGAMTLAGGIKTVKIKAGKNKKKCKGGDGGDKVNADGSSSSSTEDYEIPDIELLNRKKKSGFRLTIERVQQSFRRQGGTGTKSVAAGTPIPSGRHSVGPGFLTGGVQRWSKTDVPLPAPPCDSDASGTAVASLCRESKDVVLQRNGSDKSKLTNSSGSPGEVGLDRLRQPVLTEGLMVGGGGDLENQMKIKRSVRDSRKSGEDSEREKTKDSGIFDGILRQFRKGSAKLRGRGSRGKG